MPYTIQDFSKWNATIVREEPPKCFCKDCKDNTWCVHTPWVSECDEGEKRQ